MARRNSATIDEVDATDEVTETPEAPATDEVTPTPEVAPKAESVVDTSAFEQVVSEVIAEADSATGNLSDEALTRTTEAYRGLDGLKSKNAARTIIETEMREAIMNDDGPRAKSFVLIRKSLSTEGAKAAPAKPKDPTEAFVSKVAQVVAAQEILSTSVPEGVAEDWVEQVTAEAHKLAEQVKAALADEDTNKAELSAEVRRVMRLVSGRAVSGAASTYTGPRRNVGNHIANAFADKQSGDFLTVNEIAKTKSEEYGDDEPSSGAITARLFPQNGKPNLPEGIVPVVAEDSPDGKSRGARKV